MTILLADKMSDNQDDLSLTSELDYDMWQGQFEFVGVTDRNVSPQGLLRLPPYLPSGSNGVKKSSAHQWCENVSDQVYIALFI